MQSSRGTDAKQSRHHIGEAEFDELRLMRMVAGGDRDAFDSLYRRYFHRLYHFLDRMTHSATTIEEVVNETMLIVWRRSITFNERSRVSTWIFTIAFRIALKAVKYLEEPLDFGDMLRPGTRSQAPDTLLSSGGLPQQLEQALRSLPFEQRIVASLSYYENADYTEIAQIMGCSLNNVKTRMLLARKRLKDLLGDRSGDI